MISTATMGLLILLSLVLLLHFLILLNIIPYHIIWGGKLKSKKEMYRFEFFSVLINSLFIFVILAQASFLNINLPIKIITYALWFMTCLFLLNTFGNAVSKNKIERLLFTPITLLLFLFSLVLAVSNKL